MTEETRKIIDKFEADNRKLWGDKFFVQRDDDRVILMTDSLVRNLTALVKNTDGLRITSLDQDESVGEWYRVKVGTVVQIHHYHRSKNETDRLLQDLPRKDMMTVEEVDGKLVTKNELMGGELFRGVAIGKWIAAAVYHDFTEIAPKVIGWVRLDNQVEKVTPKNFYRPENIITLKQAVSTLVNLPYHLGGKSLATGFDCSSTIQWIFLHTKRIWLPKLAKWQIMVGKRISDEKRRKGDLVFFEKSPNWSTEHVGILISKNTMFHAYSDNLNLTAESPENIVINRKGTTRLSGYFRIMK